MLIDSIIFWGAICGLCGMLSTLLLTPVIRRRALERNLLDRMGQFHTTHTVAVPRLGGLALVSAFIVITLAIFPLVWRERVTWPEGAGTLFFTCLAMFALGFWDDLRPLGAKVKLAVQILVATVAYLGGLEIGQWVNPFTQTVHVLEGALDGPLTVLWLVGVTNLINLVDGVDGLAAGLALLLMALLAVVSGTSGNLFSLLLAVGVIGALLGFLYYNFPPAKIFMGDGGAYFLGMLIGGMALLNSRKGEVAAALIAPFFALGLPVIDASFTIVRRGLLGLPIFRADRRHIHHRLGYMGFSQRRVVLLLYAFCGFFALLALGVFVSEGRWLPVLFGVFMIVMLGSARAFGFVRNWYKLGRLFSDSMIRRKQTRYALLLGRVLLLEAERCASLDELWNNFGLNLEKLGFQAVVLKCGDEQRRWARGGTASVDGAQVIQEMKGNPSFEMAFHCEEGQWDEDTLRILSELAAESWGKASARWRDLQPE